jgi:hypothetical protein
MYKYINIYLYMQIQGYFYFNTNVSQFDNEFFIFLILPTKLWYFIFWLN